MKGQEAKVKSHFDGLARNWNEFAYDPGRTFLRFPTGKVRQEVVMSEMNRLGVGKSVIDLGCGTGQLVISLLRGGYEASGIDSSSKMISEARTTLVREMPQVDSAKVFQERDILSLEAEGQHSVVTAMGALEYVEDDNRFFETVSRLLEDGGYAFIECRNRMFNLCSGNQYTLTAADTGDLRELIAQLDSVDRYSPVSMREAAAILRGVLGDIAAVLKGNHEDQNIAEQIKPKDLHKGLQRRQYTPGELEEVLRGAGLKLKHVVYYHFHAYLPRYEQALPLLFNRIACLMQPLGYTPLGATTCSAFVAVIKKRS